MRSIAFIFVILQLSFQNLSAQDFFRISADFTTKTNPAEGKPNLTKGKVYYDKYTKELIYDVYFPEREKWIVQDTRIYKLIDDSVFYTEEVPSMNEFTIFHLALNSNLSYFGLDKANYSISKVDKKADLIISYWKLPPHIKKIIGNVAVAQKDGRLHSVIISNENQQIISKQFFKEYISVKGFEFPAKVTQIFYDSEKRESFQLLEFKNIVLNDTENNEHYHYDLPK